MPDNNDLMIFMSSIRTFLHQQYRFFASQRQSIHPTIGNALSPMGCQQSHNTARSGIAERNCPCHRITVSHSQHTDQTKTEHAGHMKNRTCFSQGTTAAGTPKLPGISSQPSPVHDRVPSQKNPCGSTSVNHPGCLWVSILSLDRENRASKLISL